MPRAANTPDKEARYGEAYQSDATVSVHKLAKYCTEDPFTRIPNTAINDERLDLKARGLLVFMLSKPNGWTFRERSLANQTGVGRDQLRGAMQKLIDTGYVIRKWEPRGDGPPVMVTEVYDRARSPEVGNPEVGKPDRRETQPISNERVLVTKENNLAAAPRERQPRPKDQLFEAVAEACGYELSSLTTTARGRVNAAAKELRQIGATPQDIAGKAQAYRIKYPDMTLTPQALTGNWPNLETARRKIGTLERHCPLCGLDVTLAYHEQECANEAAARNSA